MVILLLIYQDKKKKYEPPIPTRVGKKQKKTKGPDAANKLPQGTALKRHLQMYIATRINFLKVSMNCSMCMFWMDNHVHQNIFLKSVIRYVTFNRFAQVLKNLESPGILLWHYPGLESRGKRLLVLGSSKNLINSSTDFEIYGRQ